MNHFVNPGEDLIAEDEWGKVIDTLGLTTREAQVARLLMEGQSRYRIARELKCSPNTIRVYIDNLFEKLHVQDKVGIVLRIVRVWLSIREG